MQERRKYVRLNIPLEVSYNIQGKGDQWHRSVTKNISPNGARFVIEQDLPKGAILELKIKLPIRTEPIPIKARVVWTKKGIEQESAIYDAGLEFTQISEEDKNIFFQYFCNLMYEQFKKFE